MATSYTYDASTAINENFSALVVSASGTSPAPRLHLGLCPMCASVMNDERLLPCSHSICGGCVSAHLWSPVLVCPVCRVEHPLERVLGGLYGLAGNTHSPMEKILLDLIHTSNGDFGTNVDARRNFSGDSNSTSSSNSTPPTVTHSPLITPNGGASYKCNDVMSPSGGAIPKARHSGAQPFNSFHANHLKERSQMFGSLSVLNELFPRKEVMMEGVGKMPPLSPIVGGETRHVRMTLPFGARKATTSPMPRDDSTCDVPCCVHGGSVVEYYCTACKVAFCGECLAGHKNHRFTPLREAENLIRGLLRDLLTEAQSREKDVEDSFAKLKGILESLEINTLIAEKEIGVAFRRIMEIVEERKNQMLERLQRVRSLKIDILFKQMNTLKGARGHLLTTQRGIMSKIGYREAKDLIGAHVTASEGLRRTERIALDLSPHEDATLSFHADLKEVLDSMERFGRIHSMGHAASTTVLGVGTEVALLNTPTHFCVRCIDHSGERRMSGGDDVQATLTYPSGKRVALPVTDYNNGEYTGMFVSHERGEHTLFVTLRGIPVFNSGQRLRVKYRRPYREMKFPALDTFGKSPIDHTTISRGWGVHCDRDGTVFVTERDIHCVLVFGSDLRLRRKFGHYGDRDGELNRPAGITVDVSRRVIVVDKDNHRIQIFTLEGQFLMRFGRRGTGNGEFQYPWDVDTNAKGHILVSDSRNHRVQLFDKDGTLLRSTDETLGKCNFKILEIPRGVCFDQHGNVLVADFNNHHVLVLSPQLQLLSSIGRYGESDGQFFRPQGVFVDPKGYIFVAESKTNRVQIFSPNKRFYGRIINPDKEQKPFCPCDVSMSPDGFLYVVDIDEGCVFKL